MRTDRKVTLICSPIRFEEMNSFLLNLPSLAIRIDQEVYLVHLDHKNLKIKMTLSEVYKTGGPTVCNGIPSGALTALDGSLNENELLRIAHRRSNLQGRPIKVVAQVGHVDL